MPQHRLMSPLPVRLRLANPVACRRQTEPWARRRSGAVLRAVGPRRRERSLVTAHSEHLAATRNHLPEPVVCPLALHQVRALRREDWVVAQRGLAPERVKLQERIAPGRAPGRAPEVPEVEMPELGLQDSEPLGLEAFRVPPGPEQVAVSAVGGPVAEQALAPPRRAEKSVRSARRVAHWQAVAG